MPGKHWGYLLAASTGELSKTKSPGGMFGETREEKPPFRGVFAELRSGCFGGKIDQSLPFLNEIFQMRELLLSP